MGCVSSTFLEEEEGGAAAGRLGHHIVSLTSTTYGLLTTLDHPPPAPPPPPPPSTSRRPSPSPRSDPEIINSWELMAGLDPTTPIKSPLFWSPGKENSISTSIASSHTHRSLQFSDPHRTSNVLRPSNTLACSTLYSLTQFEKRCPPGGENSLVIYTTTLRGIRKTFEDCNAVRAALEGIGVLVREKDVSMDMGFREELRMVMAGSKDEGGSVPRVFVRGRYIGGAEVVLRMNEEGGLAGLMEGLPKSRGGGACDGCGGARFLPCFRCSGSRKLVVKAAEGEKGMVVRCPECNENGLVLCPICCLFCCEEKTAIVEAWLSEMIGSSDGLWLFLAIFIEGVEGGEEEAEKIGRHVSCSILCRSRMAEMHVQLWC